MTTQPRLSAEPQPAADLVRSVHVIGRDEEDPAEPWEQPASSDELTELSTRRFERLPHRPANLGEVPEGALDDLRPVLGDLRLDQLFIIPRTTRMVGATAGAHWVVTPTEVLAVGSDRLAVWINDDDGPRIRATIPFSEVVAVSDRTILLYSRLELDICHSRSRSRSDQGLLYSLDWADKHACDRHDPGTLLHRYLLVELSHAG